MTEPEAAPNDENPTGELPSEETPEQSDTVATGDDVATDAVGEDELPEEEELTPEIVEEEAVRGDFMLRWACVFLAVLVGFGQIADTRVLVHVRSGEHLAANGFLPSGDVFSYATDGDSVANVSWLFDLLVYGVYSVGGMLALSIFKALMAGIIAWVLSQISVRGTPTWWSSVCGVFAIVACSVDFVPITDLMTLMGVVCTLSILHKYEDQNLQGLAWKLPLLVAVWANFDTHAFVGVMCIVLYAVGAKLRQARAVNSGEVPGPDVGAVGKAAVFSIVALLVNPAPVASALSVVTTYSVMYPGMAAMRPIVDSDGNVTAAASFLDGRTEYFSLFSPGLGGGFEFAYLAGYAVIAIAFIVLVIGRSRADLPWALMLTGAAALAVATLHELPAAALVAAVTAGVSAQRWYARTFRQEYSVATLEVLFSRGGRAVTVLAFAFLAFVIVADRVPTRSPIGLGLEADLAATVESLGDELREIPDDNRIMNTRMSQGDLLIWHGRQSFIDSRVVPFGRVADPNSVIGRFNSLRHSLHISKEQIAKWDEDPEAAGQDNPLHNRNWLDEYSAFGISQIMVRLAPPGPPAYSVVLRFLRSPEWKLTGRGSSAMFFGRSDDEKVVSQALDLRKLAFQDQPDDEFSLARTDFGREPDFYQKYVYASRPVLSKSLREAQHYFSLDTQVPPQFVMQLASQAAANPREETLQRALGHVMAGPLLAVRRTQAALQEDPQNAAAYRLLGLTYQRLRQFEGAVLQAFGGMTLDDIRYMQAVMAYRQATVIDPDVASTWQNLGNLYAEQGRTDLALECLDRFLELREAAIRAAGEAGEEQLEQMQQAHTAWKNSRDSAQVAVDEALSADGLSQDPAENALQKLELAQRVYSQGNARVALNLMDAHLDQLRALPAAELLRGTLLLETGQLEEGWKVLSQLASFARSNSEREDLAGLDWHKAAAIAELGRGDYDAARSVWSDKMAVMRRGESELGRLAGPLTAMLPLTAATTISMGLPQWPTQVVRQAQLPVGAVQSGKAETQYLMAMVDIEGGNVNQGKREMLRIVEEAGRSPHRAMALVYLYQLDDDAGKIAAATTLNDWEEFEIAGLDPATPSVDATAAQPSTEGPEQAAPEEPSAQDESDGSSDNGSSGTAPESSPEGEVEPSAESAAATEGSE